MPGAGVPSGGEIQRFSGEPNGYAPTDGARPLNACLIGWRASATPHRWEGPLHSPENFRPAKNPRKIGKSRVRAGTPAPKRRGPWHWSAFCSLLNGGFVSRARASNGGQLHE